MSFGAPPQTPSRGAMPLPEAWGTPRSGTPRSATLRAATPRGAAHVQRLTTPRAATPLATAKRVSQRAGTPLELVRRGDTPRIAPSATHENATATSKEVYRVPTIEEINKQFELEKRNKMGDGGTVDEAAAEAALGRRSKLVREQLRDLERVYDPAQETGWEKKYKFFSENKMKATYRTYARARHDPFNKDPSWGKSVLADVSRSVEKKGLTPEGLFYGIDIDGDNTLSRPEIKRALTSVIPTLGDYELTAIFDVIDADCSGEVTLEEFVKAMDFGRTSIYKKEDVERWRNPIHRIKRLAPAQMEGWDHLDDNVADDIQKESKHLMARLSSLLQSSPRALVHNYKPPKYLYFGGGADLKRFENQNYLRSKRESSSGTSSATVSSDFPDPGGADVRPGFLCSKKANDALVLKGFSALNQSPRRAATPLS
mmetsp:Transcript_10210/g.18623  ORF Transcript_10210/g.18623 Transcript_10210/m.18623 type:complete len:428 (-) Transcript_10210:29-1312(-)